MNNKENNFSELNEVELDAVQGGKTSNHKGRKGSIILSEEQETILKSEKAAGAKGIILAEELETI